MPNINLLEKPRKILSLFTNAVASRGGGPRAVAAVAVRAYQMTAALGWAGLMQRINGARLRHEQSRHLEFSTFSFPQPSPAHELSLKVGVMAHVFYADLLDDLVEQIAHIPVPFVLLVSVVDTEAQQSVSAKFASLRNLIDLKIRIVPNRGRDLLPLFVTFRDEILALDLVCHIHTKKSLYTGSEKSNWRNYLLASVLGSSPRISWILGMFQATPKLGMVYPDSFHSVPLIAHSWLSNQSIAADLGARLGIPVDPHGYLDFPAGSFFWFRPQALLPLYSLGLRNEDFPEETGQTDGSLQHALERMVAQVVRSQDMLLGVLPQDGALALSTEGDRNWQSYFEWPIAHRLSSAAIGSSVVSFDLFDTLVLRPFLHPSGARSYLAHLAKVHLGIQDFQLLRERAETRARDRARADVDSNAIYAALSDMPDGKGLPINQLRSLELETEKRLLKPRIALTNALVDLKKHGKRTIAVSDMYLTSSELRVALPFNADTYFDGIYVSCETGMRKDDGRAWAFLPAEMAVPRERWLHVGDNEHADIQRPHDAGFMPPVHVLRPSALLELVPALRPLRLSSGQKSRWEDQLVAGLLANRFADLADAKPNLFRQHIDLQQPRDIGYLVLGPLLLDYLTWLLRLGKARKIDRLLFLSREGFLLEKAFQLLRKTGGEELPQASYLLASRRGVGTPSLHDKADFDFLLGGTFTGSLQALLRVRFGDEVSALASRSLSPSMLEKEIYLPEQLDLVIEKIEPISDQILSISKKERGDYLRYWHEVVGNDNVLLSDIGYAGTIQRSLSRLIGKELNGAYFALNERASELAATGSAIARYGSVPLTSECAVLKHDLLLERLLSAPYGQFSHFVWSGGTSTPCYVAGTLQDYGSVAQAHDGALDFVAEACAIIGQEIIDLEFDASYAQQPLACLGKGLWRSTAWLSKLRAEDHFSGRGEVSLSPPTG